MTINYTELIKKFIPTATRTDETETNIHDSLRPGVYSEHIVRRSHVPYEQDVCLYIDSQPIEYPMFDAGETSLVEGVELATGKTPVGYWNTEGELITYPSTDTKQPYVACIDESLENRYACLYLLR